MDWALLPAHILDAIVYHLITFTDFVRFAAVCKPWLSVAIHNEKNMILSLSSSPTYIPMLIVQDTSLQHRSLYDITNNKVLDNIHLNLPNNIKRFCGSSYGWLAAMGDDSVITLINPCISGANSISLPPIPVSDKHTKKIDEYFVDKLVLSANPLTCDDYMIAAIPIDLRRLVVIKRGDKSWTSFDDEKGWGLDDVTYYKGMFYATNNQGDFIVSIGLGDDGKFMVNPQLISKEPIFDLDHYFETISYILESSLSTRDLLYVQRHIDFDEAEESTVNFKVAKLNNKFEWIEIDNIGDQALFIGENHSFSIVASEYPGLQPNSIYFTDNWNSTRKSNGPRDMGVFSLENKSIVSHYTPDPSNNNLLPPIWIVPTLQGKFEFSSASFLPDSRYTWEDTT